MCPSGDPFRYPARLSSRLNVRTSVVGSFLSACEESKTRTQTDIAGLARNRANATALTSTTTVLMSGQATGARRPRLDAQTSHAISAIRMALMIFAQSFALRRRGRTGCETPARADHVPDVAVSARSLKNLNSCRASRSVDSHRRNPVSDPSLHVRSYPDFIRPLATRRTPIVLGHRELARGKTCPRGSSGMSVSPLRGPRAIRTSNVATPRPSRTRLQSPARIPVAQPLIDYVE